MTGPPCHGHGFSFPHPRKQAPTFVSTMKKTTPHPFRKAPVCCLGLLLFLTLMPLSARAQVKFGYLSYRQAFHNMPGFAVMQKNLSQLQRQFDEEAKRAENEFNQKYEEFLTAQQAMAPAIRQKRQAELQELMEKNIAFKGEAARLLEAARLDAEKPLKETLNNLLADIGRENGFAFILNTDDNACPYIDADMGEDIGPEVLKRLSTP